MKKFFKLILGFIIALIILIIAMVACTSFFASEVDKELKKGDEVSSVDSTQSTDDKKQATPKNFAFGDTLKVGDIQLTVSKAQNQSPDQYIDTKNNNVVVFDVTAVNTGTNSVFISSGEFNLYINDEKTEEYFGSEDTPISGDLNKGKTLKGKIFFDAPKGQNLELIYKPSFSWSDNEVVFKGNN
ncbi:DUF4352 domain-containing protein [Exiguobacterium undae]